MSMNPWGIIDEDAWARWFYSHVRQWYVFFFFLLVKEIVCVRNLLFRQPTPYFPREKASDLPVTEKEGKKIIEMISLQRLRFNSNVRIFNNGWKRGKQIEVSGTNFSEWTLVFWFASETMRFVKIIVTKCRDKFELILYLISPPLERRINSSQNAVIKRPKEFNLPTQMQNSISRYLQYRRCFANFRGESTVAPRNGLSLKFELNREVWRMVGEVW